MVELTVTVQNESKEHQQEVEELKSRHRMDVKELEGMQDIMLKQLDEMPQRSGAPDGETRMGELRSSEPAHPVLWCACHLPALPFTTGPSGMCA